jgi:hypothetical protein
MYTKENGNDGSCIAKGTAANCTNIQSGILREPDI